MRYGICVGTSQIKYLKKLGCDFAEVSLSGIHEMSDEELDTLVEECNELGIKIEATNGFFPSHIGLVWPGFNAKTIAEYTNKALARAAKLGVKVCVLGSGRNRMYGEDYNHEDALNDFKKVLSITGDIAKKYGIIVAIEPLSYVETNIINTVKEAYDVMRSVNHDNVKVMADFYHMRNNGEEFDILREIRDNLVHVHLSCYTSRRKFPVAANEDRYKEFFDILREINYEGRISIEANVADLVAEGEIALPMIKGL